MLCWATDKEDWNSDNKVLNSLKKNTPAMLLFDVTEYEVLTIQHLTLLDADASVWIHHIAIWRPYCHVTPKM